MDSSIVQTGLIAIPIIVVVIIFTIVGLILLGRYWRRDAEVDLKVLRSEIRRFRTDLRKISTTIQEYDEINQDPFSTRVGELSELVEGINGKLMDIESEYVAIQEQIRGVSSNPWKSIIGAPPFWYLLRHDLEKIKEELSGLTDPLHDAQDSESSLIQLGWEVALHAREARAVDQQVRLLMDHLQSKNVHGDAFDDALQRESRARESLGLIPEFFMTADKEIVLADAEEKSISKTYSILAEARPDLDALLGQIQVWERQYHEASKSVTRMRRVLGGVDGAATVSPEILDLNEFNMRLDGLNIICQNLHATLSRLEVESMPAVIEEAGRVQFSAQEMDASLKDAHQKVSVLESELDSLQEGMKRLSMLIADLAARKTYPLIWDQSQPAFSELERQVKEMHPIDRLRTIDQVLLDLETATQLNEERNTLARQCQTISDQYSELLKILSSPEIRHAKAWLQNARETAGKAVLFSPANWPSSDNAAALPADLDTLETQMNHLVFENPDRPIREGEVAVKLNQTQELSNSYMKQRGRLKNIQARLDDIVQLEKLSADELKNIEAVLTQMAYLVGSNYYLNRVAGKQLERFDGELAKLSKDLSHRELDTVEKKARKIDALSTKLEGSAANLSKQLDKELQSQVKTLSESITSLEEIAVIDEQPLYEARRLLSSAAMYGESASKGPADINSMIQDLKRRSDYWQECNAANRGVQDIETPVTESYKNASESREYVHEQFNDLNDWLKRTRDWPPTNVKLDNEALELNSLDAQWKSIRGTTTKAINLVQRLGMLGGKYQTLAEKVNQAGERVADEQGEADELENELDDYLDRWQAQWRAHRDSQQADREINQLLADAERDMKGIRSDYRQGKIDYDGVEQALKLLHRRVRLAQVSVDDRHVIDLNGRSIAYRE